MEPISLLIIFIVGGGVSLIGAKTCINSNNQQDLHTFDYTHRPY